MGLGSGIRDPGSGIRKKPIPDPGSRGQKGIRSRIPDPDPQQCRKQKTNPAEVQGGRPVSFFKFVSFVKTQIIPAQLMYLGPNITVPKKGYPAQSLTI
jgi:hypothetical protein